MLLIDSSGSDTMPVFSPDGTKIAYAHNDPGESDYEIYVADANGQNPHRITDNDIQDLWPDWAPDSLSIVYTCQPAGESEICVVGADGGNQQLLTPDSFYDGYPVWSPDGSRIAFESDRPNGTTGGVFTMDPNGGDVQPVSVEGDYDPDWQPLSVVTPSPTPTPAPPTPTGTVTPTGGAERRWGDSDCDSAISSRDNQALLRTVLQQPPLSQTEPCPDLGDTVTVGGVSRVWGDWDCDGAISSRDNQALLRAVLQQNLLSQTEPCPDIGTAG